MREYLKALKYRLHKNEVSLPVDGTLASSVRIGVPLAIAILSGLGWYASSFARQSPSAQSNQQAPAATQSHDMPEPPMINADAQVTTDLQVTQSQSADDSTSEAKLYVNSEEVAIPDNGTVHRVIQNDNGTTTVDISVDTEAHGSTEQSSSMNVEVYSRSETDTHAGSEEGP